MFDESLDLSSLRSYLTDHLSAADHVEVFGEGGGYSNETLYLQWDDRKFVVRKPPSDETTSSAHDVLREFRILEALQNTNVPVPNTVVACDNVDILGREFYVMEYVNGEVIRSEEPERFATPSHRVHLAEEFIDALAAIHGVDYESVGLHDLGSPEGYLERQVGVFSDSLEWAADVTFEKREVPKLFEVGDWLVDSIPTEAAHTLVHGDYKLDNVLFGTEERPRVVAVLDWELSTLGDPLADLAFVLQFWPDPSDDPDERVVAERFGPSFLANQGYPTRKEFIDRYEQQANIEFENRRFYLGLAAYKTAVVREMFYARYLRGGAVNPMYESMGNRVPRQARRAKEIVEGEWKA